MRTFALVFALLVPVFVLGACGKKNLPEHPDEATYPRQYPTR